MTACLLIALVGLKMVADFGAAAVDFHHQRTTIGAHSRKSVAFDNYTRRTPVVVEEVVAGPAVSQEKHRARTNWPLAKVRIHVHATTSD